MSMTFLISGASRLERLAAWRIEITSEESGFQADRPCAGSLVYIPDFGGSSRDFMEFSRIFWLSQKARFGPGTGRHENIQRLAVLSAAPPTRCAGKANGASYSHVGMGSAVGSESGY